MGRRKRASPLETQADRKVAFLRCLTHTKGPDGGKPFQLYPFQEFEIVRPLFAERPDGLRVHRIALIMLPRKNGKTELCAGLALDGLVNDGEIGAEVYCAAADKDQASIVFNAAATMVRNSEELSDVCEVLDSTKRIVVRSTGSVMRAISAEAYTKHGYNASRVIYDELHVAPDGELWDVLISSMGARAQPLAIAITTAGYDKQSILYQLYTHALKVKAGIVDDPEFFSAIWEAPADADWQDEAVWRACNPAIGLFRSLEEMRSSAKRAAAIPARQNAFRRLYLNQWTESAERWIADDAWQACPELEAIELSSDRRAWVGVDLASTNDLACIAVLLEAPGGYLDVEVYSFIPEGRIEDRVSRARVPYDVWVREGWLEPTPGLTIDYARIERKLAELLEAVTVADAGFDPWNATDLMIRMQDNHGMPVEKVRQTFPVLSDPTKRLEGLIVSGKVRHTANPVLRWALANVSLEIDAAGNCKVSKRRSTEKVDPVCAVVNALERYLHQAEGASVYEENEPTVLG